MRKGFLILLTLIILSGCNIARVDNYDYDKLINKILSFDIKMLNKVGNGYKYYTPKGVVRVDSNSYNDTLKRNNTLYYLYVDVVSYYYKNEVNYKKNKKTYYSYVIKDKNNRGYVEVIEKNNKLYVKMTYNYAKIETYTDKQNLKQALSDISYVLSSVKFNDSLLKKMYELGDLSSKEEVYKLFNNKGKEGNFLEYIKEYDKYDGDDKSNQVKEEEIKVEDTTTSTTISTITDDKKEDVVTSSSKE